MSTFLEETLVRLMELAASRNYSSQADVLECFRQYVQAFREADNPVVVPKKPKKLVKTSRRPS